MEEELKAAFPEITVELIEGSGSVFDVVVDGTRIFSKKEGGPDQYRRFPEEGEITTLISQLKA
ncbi:MAG: Rdx family protein [Campylobacterales bacterium]|nr:Rdx family protein [Campylobacterales bacterium]